MRGVRMYLCERAMATRRRMATADGDGTSSPGGKRLRDLPSRRLRSAASRRAGTPHFISLVRATTTTHLGRPPESTPLVGGHDGAGPLWPGSGNYLTSPSSTRPYSRSALRPEREREPATVATVAHPCPSLWCPCVLEWPFALLVVSWLAAQRRPPCWVARRQEGRSGRHPIPMQRRSVERASAAVLAPRCSLLSTRVPARPGGGLQGSSSLWAQAQAGTLVPPLSAWPQPGLPQTKGSPDGRMKDGPHLQQ